MQQFLTSLLPLIEWMQHYAIVGAVAVFVLMSWSLFRPSRRKELEEQGKIPLDDEP